MAKGGKYAGVINDLPRELELDDPKKQERINQIKDKVRREAISPENPTGLLFASRLATKWADLRAEKDDIKAELSAKDDELEAFAQLMMDQFENEGVKSQKLADGQSVSIRWEPAAKVIDKKLFQKWCIDNGMMDQLMLPSATTTSIVKQRVLAGDPEPDGVEATSRKKVSLTKG